VYTQPGGGTIFEGPPGVEMVDGAKIVSKGDVPDPTTPRPGAETARGAKSPLECSLGEAAQRISERLKPADRGDADLAAVEADRSIASKTVCLAGDESASPAALARAVADVYGLSLKHAGDGSVLRIVPRTARTVDDPTALGEEVWRLLPAPFRRAVRAESSSATGETPGGFSPARSSAVYVASVRRLREIVEPEIDRRADHRLPLSAAGDEARSLVALSSLATFLYEFRSLTRPVPSYITNFPAATLSVAAGKAGDANTVQFAVRCPNSQGKGTSGISGEVTFPAL
jgi:hypothetical protein